MLLLLSNQQLTIGYKYYDSNMIQTINPINPDLRFIVEIIINKWK